MSLKLINLILIFHFCFLLFSKRRPIDFHFDRPHARFRRRPPYRYRVYLYILTRSDEVQIDPAILIHLLVSAELRLPFYTGTHLSFAKEWRSRLGDLFQLGAGFTARRILADKTEIYFPTSVQMSCKLPTNCPVPSNHVYDDTFYLIPSKLCIASRIERWRAFCAHLGFIWKKKKKKLIFVRSGVNVCGYSWSCSLLIRGNKVRKFMVKLLRISLLNVTVVTFEVTVIPVSCSPFKALFSFFKRIFI